MRNWETAIVLPVPVEPTNRIGLFAFTNILKMCFCFMVSVVGTMISC